MSLNLRPYGRRSTSFDLKTETMTDPGSEVPVAAKDPDLTASSFVHELIILKDLVAVGPAAELIKIIDAQRVGARL